MTTRWTPTDRDLAAAAIRHAQEQNHGCHRTAAAVLEALTGAGWAPPTPEPTGPAILGRALLDGQGNAWPANDREWAESERGPVREVLLVDPSVARVLDVAREMAAVLRLVAAIGAPLSPPGQALVAAVDALAAERAGPPSGTEHPA
jgi:hypothetical protein